MYVAHFEPLLESPFVIVNDDGKQLYNSIEEYHDIPFDVANMEVRRIRSVKLDGPGMYKGLPVIVLDV